MTGAPKCKSCGGASKNWGQFNSDGCCTTGCSLKLLRKERDAAQAQLVELEKKREADRALIIHQEREYAGVFDTVNRLMKTLEKMEAELNAAKGEA
jgi:hypothetical protein